MTVDIRMLDLSRSNRAIFASVCLSRVRNFHFDDKSCGVEVSSFAEFLSCYYRFACIVSRSSCVSVLEKKIPVTVNAGKVFYTFVWVSLSSSGIYGIRYVSLY